MKPLLFTLISLVAFTSAFAQQPTKSDLEFLRKNFAAHTSGQFEIVRDRVVEHSEEWRGGTYMLIHIRPKKSGKYKLTYAHNVNNHELYRSSESEYLIRVGAKNCKRDINPHQPEWTLFCLGDTIVLPLRMQDTSNPSFRLESDLSSVPDRYPYYPSKNGVDKTPMPVNPLAKLIIYHGFHRLDQLSRAATGGGSMSYDAVFEAKTPGRFNIGITRTGVNDVREFPVIIVRPGVPVTALLPFEKITEYNKDKSYSSTNERSYKSTLEILQPGDTIRAGYSVVIVPQGREALNFRMPGENESAPVITALPFKIADDNDYQAWIAEYLPK